MSETEDLFGGVRDVLKVKSMWFAKPTTLYEKIIRFYSISRLLTCFIMLAVAMIQIYYYGMSYVVHDSFVFVPLGMLALTLNVYTALNFEAILKTVAEYQTLIESIPPIDRDIIRSKLSRNQKSINILKMSLDGYILGSSLTHIATMSGHYFFGIPEKSVMLPLLYEKFLEGNYELRPTLVFVAILSVIYITLLTSFSGFMAVTTYCMNCSVAITKTLARTLETTTAQAGEGTGRLPKSLRLGNPILRHTELIRVTKNMVSWNAFPLAVFCKYSTILLCATTLTSRNAIIRRELTTLGVWGSFLVVNSTILFVFCFSGQEVEFQSEELITAMYGLPWHRDSPKARRDVALMIAQGNRLIKINYMGLEGINLAKALEVVQTAYTYFTLLSSVNE